MRSGDRVEGVQLRTSDMHKFNNIKFHVNYKVIRAFHCILQSSLYADLDSPSCLAMLRLLRHVFSTSLSKEVQKYNDIGIAHSNALQLPKDTVWTCLH
ncbi:hypothetical protein AcV5_009306 [Taiwanofungus camphoratus]|nr:hypothetical protein AcV5_009306 [Antrodia cinnamomea]KAI0924664.1 hypothetical protein AcW2_005482 [Antrodia cinnamomea]